MNREKVKNLLPVAVTSSAPVTETETNPFTRNLNLSFYSIRNRRLYALTVTLTAIETMPVFPDSS